MRRPLLALVLTCLAALAVPGLALAARAKLSPTASALSGGATSVEAANPNGYAMTGKVSVVVKGRTVASRSVRLPKRSVTQVRLRLGAKALAAVRAAGGRATIAMKVRRKGGKATIAKRTVTIPGATGTAGTPGANGTTAPSTTTPGAAAPQQPAPAAGSGRFVGRMGTEGPYDDLELTVSGGQIQITKTPLVPVLCLENGGSYRSALSYEIFAPQGPWTVGTDGEVQQTGISTNQLVGGGGKGITYKVTGTSQDAGKVAGTLAMSFFHSTYDVFTNTITFINCYGSQSFEAVPA
jgi:hypothetical protein